MAGTTCSAQNSKTSTGNIDVSKPEDVCRAAGMSSTDHDGTKDKPDHAAFHPVTSSNQGSASFAMSPTQDTVTRTTRASSAPQQASLNFGRPQQVRRVRKIAPRRLQPSRLFDVDSTGFGYPTPQPSLARGRRQCVLPHRAATTSATTEHRPTSNEYREPLPPTPEDHNDGGGNLGVDSGAEEHDEGADEEQEEGAEQSLKPAAGDVVSGVDDGRKLHNADRPPQTTRRKEIFGEAAKLHDCEYQWKEMWDAARENQGRSDPETETVRELVDAMKTFKENIQREPNVSLEEYESSLSESDQSELDRIARMIGNLEQNASQTRDFKERLARDIYLHAIPRTIGLLRSLLIVRFEKDKLSNSALKELIMVIKAARELCQRIYHWKPKPQMEKDIKSTTNLKIKKSLEDIEKNFETVLSNLKKARTQAREERRRKEAVEKEKRQRQEQQQRSFDQEREAAEKENRWRQEQRRCIENRHREQAEWLQRAEAELRSKNMVQSIPCRPKRKPPVQQNHEFYDVDDREPSEPHLSSSTGSLRKQSEDIPIPTQRAWQKEETIALLLLLQRERGPDRYERIQRTISDISRHIRKFGADDFLELLTRPDDEWLSADFGAPDDDVLDDLGNMEVADIEQQAKYLKASFLREMEAEIRVTNDHSKWIWLSSV